MATIQGDFATTKTAEDAINALIGAGMPKSGIRRWNIIPENRPTPIEPSNVARGARTGLVIGGITGAAIGATLGAALDASKDTRTTLPEPIGVRVVVDATPAVDVKTILRQHGATNIR